MFLVRLVHVVALKVHTIFCSSVLNTLLLGTCTYLITLRTILLMTSYLGLKVNQFLKMKDSFYRCKTSSLNQAGSWIPLAERFCPSPKLRHHLHLFMTITFTHGYLLLGSG